MEVSRIEAISPKQIDWRKLTSKEIIKYDAQGVNVPPEYLQWAKEFTADIEASDKDKTTYEMAHSPEAAAETSTQPQQTTTETDTETETGEVTDETAEGSETEEPEQPKTAAQTKRENLEDAGVSLRRQAQIFTGDSKEASRETFISNLIMSAIEDKSNSEIQQLEMYMKILLAKAESTQNELKAEIDKINDNDNHGYSLNKINRLEKELERYGTSAQTTLAGEDAEFNQFDTSLLQQSETILNAADFGSETSLIGSDLLSSSSHRGWHWLLDRIIGRRAIKVGDKTVDRAKAASETQDEALSTNSSNISKVQDFKSEVENKTGVAGIPQAKENNNQTSQETKDEGEKSGTASVTETDKAASANLDKILQAKIRKGEEANQTQG